MKLLPWILFVAALAYPLLAQTTAGKVSTLPGPVKIGSPARLVGE